jgi:hypothetical protein
MKAHVGVDSQTKLIHSVVATAANAADCTMLPHLLHGEETRVWGDQAYRGQSEVLREHAPHALDFTHQRYRYKHHIDETPRRSRNCDCPPDSCTICGTGKSGQAAESRVTGRTTMLDLTLCAEGRAVAGSNLTLIFGCDRPVIGKGI